MPDVTASQFQSLVGKKFSFVPAEGGPFDGELLEVTLLEAHDGPRSQPFSAVFVDPRKTVVLPQQIFRVGNETLGELNLFLVPIGPVSAGMRYEAIFN